MLHKRRKGEGDWYIKRKKKKKKENTNILYTVSKRGGEDIYLYLLSLEHYNLRQSDSHGYSGRTGLPLFTRTTMAAWRRAAAAYGSGGGMARACWRVWSPLLHAPPAGDTVPVGSV